MAALSTPIDVLEPDSTTEVVVDLSIADVRQLNGALHAPAVAERTPSWRVIHPDGRHSIAVGLDAEVTVEIDGHVGYYCAGMNKSATVTVHGNAGVGVAENMMSGTVRVRGNASQSAGATAHGGLLVVEGKPAFWAMRAAPRAPAAGPESTVVIGWWTTSSADSTPPLDFMT